MANVQNKIEITTNGRTMTAILADTEAASQLLTRLEKGPMSVRMNDYGGFEKVGSLPWSLPTSNRQIATSAGDIMLYQGDNIVIIYGSNSWSYTPLGRIDEASPSEIRDFLSGRSIHVVFSADLWYDAFSVVHELHTALFQCSSQLFPLGNIKLIKFSDISKRVGLR